MNIQDSDKNLWKLPKVASLISNSYFITTSAAGTRVHIAL
jgi:hypothetical protein